MTGPAPGHDTVDQRRKYYVSDGRRVYLDELAAEQVARAERAEAAVRQFDRVRAERNRAEAVARAAHEVLEGIRWKHLSAHNRRLITEARRVLRGALAVEEEQRLVDEVGEEQAVELIALFGDEAHALGGPLADEDVDTPMEPPC